MARTRKTGSGTKPGAKTLKEDAESVVEETSGAEATPETSKSEPDTSDMPAPIEETVTPDQPESPEDATGEGRIEPEVVTDTPETGNEDPASTDSEAGGAAEEPAHAVTAPARPVEPRRSGFLPLVIGGAIAAGLGFGAATYLLPQFVNPTVSPEEVAAQTEMLREQDARLETLATELEAVKTAPGLAEANEARDAALAALTEELATIRQTLGGIEARISETGERIDAFETRLSGVEKRPAEGGAASATALEAFGREMDEMRAEFDAQLQAAQSSQQEIAAAAEAVTARISEAEAEAERVREEAETVARQAAARTALSRLQAALDNGDPFEAQLAELGSAGIEVPAALSEHAQGVPSLSALREAFPPVARDALAVSLKAEAGGGAWERVGAFLRSQSGARSLSPQEGDDPDAVLSRAEAAVEAGDLAAAIGEIPGLPEEGQAAMAEWIAMAERRIAATGAVAELTNNMK